jgi:RNA polymerase sigma-B factor
LFERWQSQQDRAAREELVRRYLPLARGLAARYARTQEPFEDLFQVASLGLVKAIDRFDPERGFAFKSFAVPTIVGELKRHFRDKGWPVHLPRGLQELALKIQEAEVKLGAQSGESPPLADVAEYLGLDIEQVLEGLDALSTHHAASMDEPIQADFDDESGTRHDTVGVIDDRYALIDTTASLAVGVRQLRKIDRQVLALRFCDGLKQSEIANQVGVSQMQVSRILRRVNDELRETANLDPSM